MKLKWVTITLTTLIFSFKSFAHNGSHNEEKSNPILTESIFNLKGKWTSQDDKTISISELRGQPAIVAMVYTSCKHACSLIVEDLKKIEKLSMANLKQPVHFYLFSIDVERDTPQQLKSYATKRKLDSTQWTLLHGDSRSVRELAAVLGVRFKKEANGDYDHSNIITLLNSNGVIEFQQIGLNQDPQNILKKLAQLKL